MTELAKVYKGFMVLIPISDENEETYYRNELKNFKMQATCKVSKFYDSTPSKHQQCFLKFTFFVASDALLFKLTFAGKVGIVL